MEIQCRKIQKQNRWGTAAVCKDNLVMRKRGKENEVEKERKRIRETEIHNGVDREKRREGEIGIQTEITREGERER